MSSVKLLCFPYAGGSSVVFSKWKEYLDPRIDLQPIELAGRGSRIYDALYKDVPEAVEDVFEKIKGIITQSPYALFGHSMGGMIAYELAQKIRDNHFPAPLHTFFSARGAPHIPRNTERLFHLLSDEELKKEVIQLGGTPPGFFDYPELRNLFLPLIRNDFKLAEANTGGEIRPLDGDITVFLGKEDRLTPEECDGWKKHTHRLCTIHYLEGGHFFLHDRAEQLVGLINRIIVQRAAHQKTESTYP